MLIRVLGVAAGVSLLLFILFLRGLPVVFFLKIVPLALLLFVACAFIYAGVTKD
jgi:hypothetical protein